MGISWGKIQSNENEIGALERELKENLILNHQFEICASLL